MRILAVTAAALAALILSAAVAYAFAARFLLHGPVTATALARSLTGEAPSAGSLLGVDGQCIRERAATWRCSVIDGEGSGGASYRVTLQPRSSCWRAELLGDDSEGGMPARLDGCVHRWQWSLADLL
jgi:hypothetical protein